MPDDLPDSHTRRLKPSGRTQRLTKAMLERPCTKSFQMANLARTAYEEHLGESVIIARARVLEKCLKEMTIYLQEDCLLAGNRTEAPGAHNFVPPGIHPVRGDIYKDCYITNPDGNSRKAGSPGSAATPVTPNTFDTPAAADAPVAAPDPCDTCDSPEPTGAPDTCDSPEVWESRFLTRDYLSQVSEAALDLEREGLGGLPVGCQNGFGHILANHEIAVREGLLGVARRARTRREEFPATMQRQRDFCEAAAIACEAVADWGRRYADLARAQAETCTDEKRKAELLVIAETCARVPALPARNFREALQAVCFTQFAFSIEQFGGSISLSSMDQYLDPYLSADLDARVLTWEEASELMDSFFIMIMENAIWPRQSQMFQHLSIGGCDAEGRDLTNRSSRLILESTARMRFSQPNVSVLWHPAIDASFWQDACDCILLGFGMPAVHNASVIMDIMEKWGVPRTEAPGFGIVGCVEPSVRGKMHGTTLGGHINLLKCLELALNGGQTLLTGKRMGPARATLADFNSLNEAFKAYEWQVEQAVRLNVETVHCAGNTQKALYGYPFMSSLMDGAIENGRDLAYGAKYNHLTTCMLGISNVVDSFLALEDLVFSGGPIRAPELLDALKTDFAGYETLQHSLVTHKAKFGQGDPRFVSMYERVCEIHRKILKKYTGPRGDHFYPGVWPTIWHVVFGKKTGASVDGRKSGSPLADGAGPATGSFRSSPTDILRNMAAVDSATYFPGGYTFNLWLDGKDFASATDRRKFADLVKTFMLLGGQQIQLNVLDKSILEDAQEHPEAYRNLVVRVTGFSAYFTCLSHDLQDEIISRTQFAL